MRIFVLEGVNGAGKSLAGTLIRNAIHERGSQCIVIDPTAVGPIGRLLRERIVDPSFRNNANLDAVLFTALRAAGAQHILHSIDTTSSLTLVLERWSLALAAYGAADGTRPELVIELRAVLDSILKVDYTFLLDITGTTAVDRIASTGKRNRFEIRGRDYLDSVSKAYRIAGAHQEQLSIINAEGTPMQVCEQISSVFSSICPELSSMEIRSSGAGDAPTQLDLL